MGIWGKYFYEESPRNNLLLDMFAYYIQKETGHPPLNWHTEKVLPRLLKQFFNNLTDFELCLLGIDLRHM